MDSPFENHVLPIVCPKCGATIEKPVAWFRQNDELACPCGTTMRLVTDEILAAIDALEIALKRAQRPLADKEPV
jgi:hypothetical protein